MGEVEETPARESAQAERERHDRELAEYNKKRQTRLGYVPVEAPEPETTPEPPAE